MPRDAKPTTKAIIKLVELEGYRVGLGEYEGTWIATAKCDHDGQMHVAKAPEEHRAICELAMSVGINIGDG